MAELAQQLVAEEEGRDPCVYRDSLGYYTIAIGCLVDKSQLGAGLCDAAIDAQFAHDSANARAIAKRFPYFDDMNEVRQAVLISMDYLKYKKKMHWQDFIAALGA